MWEAIGQVTSGLTLVAFAIAAVVAVLRYRLKAREQQLRAAPPADRAALVQALNDSFLVPSLPVDPASLPPDRAYTLLLEQIHERGRRFYVTVVLVAFLAVIAAVLAAIAMMLPQRRRDDRTPTTVPTSATEMTLELNVDRYGGDYRTVTNTDADHCRKLCMEDPKCVAYTYDGNSQSSAYRSCFLKAVALAPVQKVGDVSGVKVSR